MPQSPSRFHCLSALVLVLGLAACSDSDDDFAFPFKGEHPVIAEVDIVDAANPSQVIGSARFEDRGEEGVTAVMEIEANGVITPGPHAIHIHAYGSCERADTNRDGEQEAAGAAGGHFNPEGVGHGDDNGPHPGDSEEYNYTFAADGSFSGEIRFPDIHLFEDGSLLSESGTALIIHTGTDDAVTDPTGNAGARIACGVIGEADDDFAVTIPVVNAADTTQQLGTITLTDLDDDESGVRARFAIAANDVIAPGEHAIHVHENGSCDAADTNGDGTPEAAGAAGGHYNPANAGHGEDNGPHVGDPQQYNFTFAEDGSFSGDVIFPRANLYKGYPLLVSGGTAVIIHVGTDDTVTDPTGNAGARAACAVIER